MHTARHKINDPVVIITVSFKHLLTKIVRDIYDYVSAMSRVLADIWKPGVQIEVS